MSARFVHPTALVEDGAVVGDGTSIWHHAQVRAGATVGADCIVGKGAYVGEGVSVGDRCKIQNYALLYEGATVADGVFIGPGAQLANDRFPRAVTPEGTLKTASDWARGTVAVETGASIGAGALVVPDARIGMWAMVAAGAVVTGDIVPHGLVAGNPARLRGYVCVCGRRLTKIASAWTCEGCGRSIDASRLEGTT